MVNSASSSFAEAAANAFNETVDTLVQRQQGQAQNQEQNPMAAMLAGVKLNLSGVSVASDGASNSVPNNADKGPAVGV